MRQYDSVAMPVLPLPPLYRRRRGTALPQRHRHVTGRRRHRSTASPRHTPYRLAGYRSETQESVSSLLEGGFMSTDRQLSNELAETDAG